MFNVGDIVEFKESELNYISAVCGIFNCRNVWVVSRAYVTLGSHTLYNLTNASKPTIKLSSYCKRLNLLKSSPHIRAVEGVYNIEGLSCEDIKLIKEAFNAY